MGGFTSPALTLSRPARTCVRPVAPYNRLHRPSGRQLDALPLRWSEEKYAVVPLKRGELLGLGRAMGIGDLNRKSPGSAVRTVPGRII